MDYYDKDDFALTQLKGKKSGKSQNKKKNKKKDKPSIYSSKHVRKVTNILNNKNQKNKNQDK